MIVEENVNCSIPLHDRSRVRVKSRKHAEGGASMPAASISSQFSTIEHVDFPTLKTSYHSKVFAALSGTKEVYERVEPDAFFQFSFSICSINSLIPQPQNL